MGKFKIGDKVRVKNIAVDTSSHGDIFVRAMCEYIGEKFTIKNEWCDGVYILDGLPYHWAEDWIEAVKPETIVIYRDGDKTVALDRRTGKKAEAKCSKEDTYDFYAGAKIAFERLIGEDTAKEEPKPKLYNGKVVCVTSQYVYLTKGKIYEFKNGYSQYDNGDRMPTHYDEVVSFEDLRKKMDSDFIELVED